MLAKLRNYWSIFISHFSIASNRKLLSIIALFVVVVALPAIALLAQNQQTIRQHASELVTPPFPISPPPNNLTSRVFVTSTVYNGNLGGLNGADDKCQQRANAAGLGGVWKAWLSDSTASAASRLAHNNWPYTLVDGTKIADNWNDIIEGNFLPNYISIKMFENGDIHKSGAIYAWTATTYSGLLANPEYNFHCSNWTVEEYPAQGIIGSIYSIGNQWTETGSGSNFCSNEYRLYCFEQTSIPIPTLTPTPTPFTGTPARAFVTSIAYTGNLGGLTGADAKCQERANAAKLGRTWKAWLSTKSSPVTSRVNQFKGPYKRLDGVTIANDWSSIFDRKGFINPLNITELGTQKDTSVWTGVAIGENDENFDSSCNNWTSSVPSGSPSYTGYIGNSGSINRSSIGLGTIFYCNNTVTSSLYCFEQSVAPSAIELTSIVPSAVTFGAEVTLSGSGFGNTKGGVSFYNSAGVNSGGAPITSWTDNKIVAKVPFVSKGLYQVEVETASGAKSNRLQISVVVGQPSISSITPTNAKLGDLISIKGGEFGTYPGNINFYFPDQPSTPTKAFSSFWSDTEVKVKIPTTLTPNQEYGIQIVNSYGGESSLKYYQVGASSSACSNYGDVDLDGQITLVDANLMLRFIVGSATPTDEQKKRADVNGDGKINIQDSILIQQYLAKKINTFPACGIPTLTPTPVNFFSNVQATGANGYTCFRGCSSSTTTIKYNDVTHVQEGIGSGKVTIANNATENRGFIALANKTLSAGVPIHANFYMWAASGTSFTVAIRAKTSTGSNLDVSKKTLKGNNAWQLVDLTWTTSSLLTQIGVEAYHTSSTGTSFWVDNLYISTQ